ncbi:MAG: OsmC family peroxiredoxin [Cellulomonadaceae bacterium]|jgi:osmotically inducible protein OsmC|nr:OsmC family peroxiredoxin [Cellulomonadaceae bacterium]
MAIRTAHTAWTGGLTDGSGEVELQSSGIANFTVSFPRRIADEAEGVTSPEELIAAAHSACYAMQFSHLLSEAGATPENVDVTASVELAPDPDGGFFIPGISLTVRGYAEGIDENTFWKLANEAKATCPVSKALSAVKSIELAVTFEDF